jgi:hypothetical protein
MVQNRKPGFKNDNGTNYDNNKNSNHNFTSVFPKLVGWLGSKERFPGSVIAGIPANKSALVSSLRRLPDSKILAGSARIYEHLRANPLF